MLLRHFLYSCGRLIELLPNGKTMPLTFTNRKKYCSLLKRARLAESRIQMSKIRQGIADVVPMSELFRLFTWQELRNMVCGEPIIDIEMLKLNTIYDGEFKTIKDETSTSNANEVKNNSEPKKNVIHSEHQVVKWLWLILEKFTNAERSKFLMFAWGRNRLPNSAQDFSHKMEIIGEKTKVVESLPSSMTCFFRVTLSPWYESMEVLERKLRMSMANGDLDGDEMGDVDRSAFE